MGRPRAELHSRHHVGAQALPSVTPDACRLQVLKLQESVVCRTATSQWARSSSSNLYYCTSGAVFASMMAYIAAQFCDVQLFHLEAPDAWAASVAAQQLSSGEPACRLDHGGVRHVWRRVLRGDMTVRIISFSSVRITCSRCSLPSLTPGPSISKHWLRNYLQFAVQRSSTPG